MGRLIGAWAVVLVVGCGGGGPSPATVSGTVTVDGALLSSGVITFTGPGGQSGTGRVENGRYEVRTVAGANRVQVSAPVVVATRPESKSAGAAMVEITEETLPDKYHAATELTFDAQPGSNSKDWALSGKPKRK